MFEQTKTVIQTLERDSQKREGCDALACKEINLLVRVHMMLEIGFAIPRYFVMISAVLIP